LVAFIAGLLLAPNHDAAARKFQMSGTWVYRPGSAFIPLQFAQPQLTVIGNIGYWLFLSMGNLTGAMGFPNGPIPGEGGVTATTFLPLGSAQIGTSVPSDTDATSGRISHERTQAALPRHLELRLRLRGPHRQRDRVLRPDARYGYR